VSTDVSEEHIASSALLVTCFHADFFLGLFFGPEDGSDLFFQNVG
jgi:hypothetical protein